MKKIYLTTIFTTLSFLFSYSQQKEFFISLDGDDTNQGTISDPMASIEAALTRAVRCNVDGVTVYLREGRYQVDKTIELGSTFSGREGAEVTIKAYNREEVKFSGGMQITNWIPYQNGIYSAEVPSGTVFRQLFINDRMGIKAKTPDFNGYVNCRYFTNSPGFRLRFEDGFSDFTPEEIAGAEIYIRKRWVGSFAKTDTDPSKITYSNSNIEVRPDAYGRVTENRAVSFWQAAGQQMKGALRNRLAFLNTENEWYLDVDENRVYYKPPAGVDINTSEIYAPVTERILKLDGVSFMNIEDIIFEHSTNLPEGNAFFAGQGAYDQTKRPYNGGAIRRDTITSAALELERVSDIKIKGNVIRNSGGAGLSLNQDCQYVQIIGNVISTIGASGIQGFRYPDEPLAQGLPPIKTLKYIDITDNIIGNIGTEIFSANGITIYAGEHFKVINNDIFGSVYQSIHTGWNSSTKFLLNLDNALRIKDWEIRNNEMHHNMYFNFDGAVGFHNVNYCLDTIHIVGNYFHSNASGAPDIRNHKVRLGVYLDNSTTNTIVEFNVGYNSLQFSNVNGVNETKPINGGVSRREKFDYWKDTYGLFVPILRNNHTEGTSTVRLPKETIDSIIAGAGIRPEFEYMRQYAPPSPIWEGAKVDNRYW